MHFKEKGIANLNSIKGIDLEKMKLAQENFKKMINSVKDAGIDLDFLTKLIINDFRINSEDTTKAFYKIAKKNNSKNSKKFIKDNILNIWIKDVEEKDISENIKDLRSLIDNETFITYLAGIYISIHSKSLSSEILNILNSVISEMFFLALKKVDLNKEVEKPV